MPSAGAAKITVTVHLKLKPLWKRVYEAPRTWWNHYKLLRKSSPVLMSAYVAARLAGQVVTFKVGKRKGEG